MQTNGVRHDWTKDEVRAIYHSRLIDVLFRAQAVHQQFFESGEVQLCQLLSIKTGGCPEDCAYCPQSAHYETNVDKLDLLSVEDVVKTAREAREQGVSRFCLGAAWRQVTDGPEFESVLQMVRGVSSLGLEVCCTLGMLTESQAQRLAHAGLYAYNHNLDTSADFYGQIITTRKYEERLRTLEHVRKAGVTVCCGGILGMGESDEDRVGLLHQLATLQPHPESVPINVLVRVEGTPLADADALDPLVLVRAIATARILMPSSRVRLSAGRRSLSREAIALCFMAGANSIFVGDRLLTTPNPSRAEDDVLLEELDLKPMNHG
ncbi:MAG TPA: biotin synthase BioB [Terriglobia bacterium]|nr:biotin synthase BioB [Terriglobia bacterium]